MRLTDFSIGRRPSKARQTRLELSVRGTSVSTAHHWPTAYLTYVTILKDIKE